MANETASGRDQLDELTEKHRRLNREEFEEALAANTNSFGRVDEIAMNEARAIYEIAKERISLRSLEFENDAATRQFGEVAALNAMEAKLNARWIARKVRRVEMMVIVVFIVVVGEYVSSLF